MERLSPFDWSKTNLPESFKKRLQELSNSAFNSEKFISKLNILESDKPSGGLFITQGIPINTFELTAGILKTGDIEVSCIGFSVRNGNLFSVMLSATLDDDQVQSYSSSTSTQWRLLLPEEFASALTTGSIVVYDNEDLTMSNISLLNVVCIEPQNQEEVELGLQDKGTGYLHVFVKGTTGHKLTKMSNSYYGANPPYGMMTYLSGIFAG